MSKEYSWKEKASAVRNVLFFKPFFTLGLVSLGFFVAVFEALGLGFIQPIFDTASSGGNLASNGVTQIFEAVYGFLGVSFNLKNLIIGVSAVMVLRYTSTFLLRWYRTVLSKEYEAYLKEEAFRLALNGKISYWDDKGSDEIVNHIISETGYASDLISTSTSAMEKSLLILMYVGIMTFVSPLLTLLTLLLLGGITFLLRFVLEPAIDVGSRVAEANERIQETVQAGVQGIKEVKLFNMSDRLNSDFRKSLKSYVESEIEMSRNETAIKSFYKMSAALTVFFLIYTGLEYTNLDFGKLGIFLLALYRLSGSISSLNSKIYKLEGHIAHFMRIREFMEKISENQEDKGGTKVDEITDLSFDQVSFSYDGEEALKDVSFEVEKGEFIGFAGKSGSGKSTLVSLIARMYNPDRGRVICDSRNIKEYDLESWRENLAVVQQQSFIFNTTLEKNIRIGNRDADEEELREICQIAKIDEFLEDLPEGLDTEIGDNGVKLSGGQRQRVAIARALIKKPDFLVLDEATSDLDSGLEKKVQRNIEEMDRNHGIIAIAHRLSTLKNADRIYTVQDGSIEETGTHSELLEKEGIYSKLYSIQKK